MRHLMNILVTTGMLLIVACRPASSGTIVNVRLCDEILNGNLPAVKSLLDQGADPDIKQCLNGMTPLMVAASFNHTEIMKVLLAQGAGVNDIDKSGSTALMLAADKGNIGSVNILLDSGAYINARDNADRTVLIRVLDFQEKQLDRAHRADQARAGPELRGRLAVARLLIEKGADLERKDSLGRTALAVAVSSGHAELSKMLVGVGAPVNSSDNNGGTVLMAALSGGQTDLARFLIDKGADINAADENGTTALFLAIDKGNDDMVKALVGKGVDVQAADSDGVTPLLMAVEKG